MLIRVFVDASPHIPEHRQLPLFAHLIGTVGSTQFLHTVIILLLEKHVVHAPNTSDDKQVLVRLRKESLSTPILSPPLPPVLRLIGKSQHHPHYTNEVYSNVVPLCFGSRRELFLTCTYLYLFLYHLDQSVSGWLRTYCSPNPTTVNREQVRVMLGLGRGRCAVAQILKLMLLL